MDAKLKEICDSIDNMFYGRFVQDAVDVEDYESAQVMKDFIDDVNKLKEKV
jgi:hypothetical protein